jgi:hypothetical protein
VGEEKEVRNVGKVARRHDFDCDDDDDDEGEEEFDDSQRGCISRRQGRVSSLPGLNHADLISAVSERTAELERDLKAAKDEMRSLKGELEGTRRRHEIMTKLKELPDVAIGDPEYKRLDRDLKGIICHQVLRIDKMWSDDMDLYSEDKNTYCQIILNGIKWPGSISEDEKIRIWKEFLSPRFKRSFGLERNRINQAMRKCFNSELCDVWLARKLHYAYCTISTLNTGDYGSSTYVSANKLVSWRMTTEPQKEDVMANVFINFMLKYGKFSAPKAVLEGAMKEVQLACNEESPDKEDDGDFRAGFECLTKSDQLYPI